MEAQGTVIGKKAENFTLYDQKGDVFNLAVESPKGPHLLVFYPGDFTMVCTKQLCDYQANLSSFKSFGMNLAGISKNTSEEHAKFAEKYGYDFPLLTDHKNQVAKKYGCTSNLMFGMVSRAVFIVNSSQMVLYRYVEPTHLTRRSSDQLLKILGDLKSHQLL